MRFINALPNRAETAGRLTLIRILSLLTGLILIFPISGCRLTYILHAASGQFRLLNNSIPVEEALKKDSLEPEQKDHLSLVAQIKAFV